MKLRPGQAKCGRMDEHTHKHQTSESLRAGLTTIIIIVRYDNEFLMYANHVFGISKNKFYTYIYSDCDFLMYAKQCIRDEQKEIICILYI